jgi:predicted  nucleic acid-binding Zn-ribbon protein
LHSEVHKLLQVQNLDQSIAKIRRDVDSIPKERSRREAALAGVRDEHAAAVQGLRQAEVAQRGNEVSITQSDEEIKKLEVRLNTVRNNAEYQATLLQIESVKRERARLEEEGLGLLERIEELRAAVAQQAGRLASEQQIFDEFVGKADALLETRKADLVRVSQGRGELLAGIAPDLVSRYERLFQARDGLAVCAVEGVTCTGCYTSIPPNLQVKLHAGSAVVQCNSCQRILYYPE